MQSGAHFQWLFTVIGWKPDGVSLAPHDKRLPNVKNEDPERGIDRLQPAIVFGDDVDVRNTFKPFAHAFPTRRGLKLCGCWLHPRLPRIARFIRNRRYTEKGWLH